jgi:hypothetical protein
MPPTFVPMTEEERKAAVDAMAETLATYLAKQREGGTAH